MSEEDQKKQKVELSPKEKQAIAQVSKIVSGLDKTTKSLKFYLSNNPILIKHKDELLEQFRIFFQTERELTLITTSSDFMFFGQSVYSNKNKSENFAFKLYNDGVRSITFHNGLSQDELLEFINILNKGLDLKQDADDLVTLLWEKQFQNIRYQVVESIVDSSSIEEGKSTEDRIDEVINVDKSVYYGLGEEYSDIIDIGEVPITFDATNFGEMFKIKGVLNKEELEHIKNEIQLSDSKKYVLLNFMEILPQVLQEEVTKDDIVKSLSIVRGILDSLIFGGALGIAAEVFLKLKNFSQELGKGSIPIENDIIEFVENFASQEKIDELAGSLNVSFTGSNEEITEYISEMAEKSIPSLLKALPQITDAGYRRAISEGIAKIFKGDPNSLLKYFNTKIPERVADLIFLLSQIENEKVIDLIPHLITHSDKSIKKESIAILKNFIHSPKSTKILLSTLQDPDIEIRTLSLRILATTGNKEAAKHLRMKMAAPDFEENTLLEKKSYFFAIAKIQGNEFLPYLVDVLESKRLFSKGKLDELYQCACFALGIIATEKAREILEKGTYSKNKTVKKYCQSILKKVEMGAA